MQMQGDEEKGSTGGLQDVALGFEESRAAVRVLLVDDDDAVRDVLRKGLTLHGCEVRTASHGGEALRGLLTHPVDVVVTDLKMAPMDGLTFLAEALHIWPWLGTLVFSGHVNESNRRKALELGVGAILAKPVMIDALCKAVREEASAARVRLSSRSGGGANVYGQYQFSRIWDLSRQAMTAESRQDAIRGLVAAFSDAFQSIASATLTHDAEREMLCMHVAEPVPPAFLDAVQADIAARGQMLGYQPRSTDQGVDVFGGGLCLDAPMPEPFRCVSIPLLGDGDLLGILTLVVPQERELGESFMSFLYHATNLLSSAILALDAIRQQAAYDDLTGFYNRRQLRLELANMWEMSRRYSLTLSMLVVDLDYFKNVNDQYGHLVGDQVLRELAALVRHVCRTTDVVGRYGGDELVIVVPDATSESLRILAERLQVAVHEHLFCKGSSDVHCTLSIGGASSGVGPRPKSTDELFERADAALYEAKHRGRDCVVIWAPPGEAEAETNREADVDAAVDPDRIHVLVVDDEQQVRDALGLQLGALGYGCSTASSGAEALALLAERPAAFHVIMVDLGLGDMSGLQLLQTLQEMDSAAARIVITGRATVSNTVECLRAGADDFIQKPITLEDLTLTLPHAVDYHRLRAENRRYRDHLEDLVRQRGTELSAALKRARTSLQFSLNALIRMLDARERITSTHSQRVQHLAIHLAHRMQLPHSQIATIGQGALLHDIGKIAIPDAILMKPGPLTEGEWQAMRTHPETGYRILKDSPDLQAAGMIVLHHHERYDGSGYPHGLAGENIPLGARIFAVIDAYDAMRSVRTYKGALKPREAMREILACRGTHFDPQVVDVFAQIQSEVERRGAWEREAKAEPS